MNCYRIYSFFIHKLSNAAKVINKGHLRGFSLPNVHYATKGNYKIYLNMARSRVPTTVHGFFILYIPN
ncbi:hypothetical protein CUB97_07775 [Prevotella intermedia]|uniref:Uncharacterized protein n=1 Tax=Prevotella intermedia TaxID=28131 RepID=A0A2M8MA86_PREIN|nr:hypothetical protein CUB97_07775 [Prevotella intermedia]